MARRLFIAIGFVVLLALIAKPLWDSREQWHFGQGYDDGIYMMTAKSIATGNGYRAIGLPGQPMQVKYPPLFPLYLSIAWRLTPNFPDTLRTAAELQLLLVPIVLALMLAVLRQLGLSWRRTFLVAAVNMVTMAMFLAAFQLISEMLCLCMLFGAIYAVERSAKAQNMAQAALFALAGGALTGLAYLSRSAVLPMLAAVPVFYFLRRKNRLAFFFLAIALPIFGGWHWWTFMHTGGDPNNISYLSEFLQRMRANGPAAIILQQLATMSAGVSQNFFPGFLEFLSGIPLHHIFLAGAIAGCVRMGRRQHWPLYTIFCALYLGMLLLWWFEGLTRLLLPVWPLLVAGLAEEANHIAELAVKAMEKSPLFARRDARWLQMPRWAFIALALVLIAHNDRGSWSWLGDIIADEHAFKLADVPTVSWIAEHATDDTVVLTSRDATIYLYTNAAASRSLWLLATEPKSREVAILGPSFRSLPAKYRTGMLVMMKSDFFFGQWPREFLKQAAESIGSSKLAYSTPTAMIYTFPIPERGVPDTGTAAISQIR